MVHEKYARVHTTSSKYPHSPKLHTTMLQSSLVSLLQVASETYLDRIFGCRGVVCGTALYSMKLLYPPQLVGGLAITAGFAGAIRLRRVIIAVNMDKWVAW